MEYEKRAMCAEEDKYTFSQSAQISSQCGLIGYLRADYESGYFSSVWFDYRADLKTDAFKKEFDDIINSLREKGDILFDRNSLAKYCRETPQSKMEIGSHDFYGVRVDTEDYAYLFRLYPYAGDYNVTCHCYQKHWLDTHIRNARKGIRFIDPNYCELFRIADGEKIRVKYSYGDEVIYVCRYIDDYHLEVGENLYHTCEYAERLNKIGASVEAYKD